MHFLQIWIAPNVQSIEPSYEEKHFDPASKKGQWQLIASADGRDGSVLVHQDAYIYASILGSDDALEYVLSDDRCAYVHVARGTVTVNGVALKAGDALKLVNEPGITVSGARDAEVLLFDLLLEH